MKIPLFDIDWTLIEGGNKAAMDAYDYAIKSVYGVKGSVREIVIHGMTEPQILTEILKLHDVSEVIAKEKMKQAIQEMGEYYVAHEHEGKCIPMPGAYDMLAALKKQGVIMGLLTGVIEPIAWRKVARAGLRDFFDFGAFGNMAYKRVDLIAIAKQQLKEQRNIDVPLDNFIIVGDSPFDIACAKAGGIEVIAVGAGVYSYQELISAGANFVVHSLQNQRKMFHFLHIR